MNQKTRITLTSEQETLLILLYAKAQPGNPLFYDPKAREILDRLDYDFSRLSVPYKTVILVCQRANKMDREVRNFLATHPDGVGGRRSPRNRILGAGYKPGRGMVFRILRKWIWLWSGSCWWIP